MQTQPTFFLYLEMQNPQGSPFSITPPQLAEPLLNPGEDPAWLQNPPAVSFLGQLCPEHLCLLFLLGCPSLPVLGRDFYFFFSTGFLFPLRTPCVCVALSLRHNAPLHFLGRGLGRASDLGRAESQGSRVTRGHRGQTKSLQPLM